MKATTRAGKAVWQEIEDAIESGGGQHVSQEDIAAIEAEARAEGANALRAWADAPFEESSANAKDEPLVGYGYRVAQAEIRSILAELRGEIGVEAPPEKPE